MGKPKIDIKRLRYRMGWSQTRTAQELGFSRKHINALENGKTNISIKMMYAIMRVFNVEFEDFYEYEKSVST